MRFGWFAALATIPVVALVVPAYAQLDWTLPFVEALEQQTRLSVQNQPLNAELNRLELARWLAEFFGYVPDRDQLVPVSDLQASDPDFWTAQAVLQAGVMRTFEGGDFRPQGNLTKLEALAIMVRAAAVPAPTEGDVTQWLALYQDATAVPAVGHPFIAMAGQAGMLLNIPDPALIRPDVIVTRGEGAAMLHQALVYRQRIPALSLPVAQLQPIAPVRPELRAVRITPEFGTVPAGTPLVIEAQGSPGGNAIAFVGTTVQVALRETENGLYRGEFTPTSVDFIPNPAIAIELALNGESTRWQQQFPQLTLGRQNTLSAPPPINNIFAPPAPIQPPLANQQPMNQQPFNQQPIANQPPLPSFSAIRVVPEQGNLVEGDILTVAIQAEPGGKAQFELVGLAQDQPMREVQTGIYEGTYVVSPSHRQTNPELRVIFTGRNGGSVFHRETLPLAIDGQVSTRPTVGTDAPPSLAGGLAPLIFGVDTNAANRTLRSGDVLEVQVRGERGSVATFEIVNVTPPIPLQETAPGVYTGRVTIGANTPMVQSGVLKAILSRNGQRTERSSAELISITP